MDTNGWDTVYVCSMDQINAGLRANTDALVSTFDYDDGTVRFSGEFDVWRLVPGGSEKFLRFETPIRSGKLEILGRSVDLTGVVPQLSLQLRFIDNVATAEVRDLVFDLQVPGSGPDDPTPGAVTTITADASGTLQPTDVAWEVLHDCLPKCLIANRARLAYAFASVNLVPPGAASWLAPRAYDYVYVEPAAGHTGYLGVLAVVTDRPIAQLPRRIDPALLDGNHPVCFLISPELFLTHVLLPTLPRVYGHGAVDSSFAVRNGVIHNTRRLDCGSFREGLIDYYPNLDVLAISIRDTQLRTEANGSFDITGLTDANVTFGFSATNTCRYDRATGRLSFTPDPNPGRDYEKHIPDWEKWIAILGGPLILAIVDGVTEIVTSSIADSISSSLNTGGNLTIAAAAPITVHWQGLSALNVQHAGLADGFYLRGNFA